MPSRQPLPKEVSAQVHEALQNSYSRLPMPPVRSRDPLPGELSIQIREVLQYTRGKPPCDSRPSRRLLPCEDSHQVAASLNGQSASTSIARRLPPQEESRQATDTN